MPELGNPVQQNARFGKAVCKAQKYPCIYDKNSTAYKKMIPKKNARAQIDEAVDKENSWAQQKWTLLLNRYSKKHSTYKKANA